MNAPVKSPPQNVIEDREFVQPKKFDEDFKERYTSSEYIYEQEESEGWLGNFVDWVEETVQDLFSLDTRKEASELVDNLLDIFYILVIIIVVFFIVKAIMNGEGRWVFGKRSDKKIIRHEDVTTDLHAVDFNTLIAQAISDRDYRLAIRYHYLDMLKKLSAASVISYDPDKTNFEYTFEITDLATREQFQYTSYLYNYIWYGEFNIDQQQYEKAASSFNILLKNVAA